MANGIIFAGETHPEAIARRVAAGELRRIAPGIYTEDTDSTLEDVVRREWLEIVGHEFPSAVISDRSAVRGGPVDGVLYLVHDARVRDLELPGLLVRARRGASPLDGDAALPGGLHMASRGRALAENAQLSRARNGNMRRTLTDTELADWIDRLCQLDGETRLVRYRAEAQKVAASVGTTVAQLARVSALIGTAMGSQRATSGSVALNARAHGHPVDHERLRLFDEIITTLRRSAPQHRPAHTVDSGRHLPFFEAYFSNFIEGTEFMLDEAIDIVYHEQTIPNRVGDSHDLLGTYRITSDLAGMSERASTPREFLELLRMRHAILLGGRLDMQPGEFKQAANRAGNTTFVMPELVPGTLAEGWRRLQDLDTAFERAVYTMFLIAETHPFADGNGRTARIFANSELVAGNECRIIIPTVYRTDYLDGLRLLSRQSNAELLVKVLRFAQDFTRAIDFRELEIARVQLEQAHAFEEPESPNRLIIPTR